MANVVGGTVVWNLDVDKGKLTSGLNEARDQVESAAKGIDKSLSGISKSIGDSFKGVGDTLKDMGGSMKDIGKSMSVSITAPIAAASAAALNFVTIGGKYSSVRDSFISMTKDMGISADEFQNRVSKATGGQIDNLKILQSATKGLSLIGKDAFNDFGNDFVKMAELSKKAARATGQDVDFMFDSLVTGIARESKLILDNLGITIDITKAKDEYAKSLGKTREELTISEEKHAVLNSALGQLESTYGEVAVSAGGFSGAWQQLTTQLTNTRIEIGQALEPTIAGLVKSLTPIIQDITPSIINGIKTITEWFNNLSPSMQKTIVVSVGLTAVAGPLIVVLGTIISNVGTLISALGWLVPALTSVASAIFTVVIPAIVSVVAANLPLIAIIGVITAVIGGLYWAWKNNFLGIRDFTQQVVGWLRGLLDSVLDIARKIRDSMDKINPFHRESPSLVDNVTKGLEVIRKEFGSLGDFILSPQVTPALANVINPNDLEVVGREFNQVVNIEIDKINDEQDIQALGREFGYRASLMP